MPLRIWLCALISFGFNRWQSTTSFINDSVMVLCGFLTKGGHTKHRGNGQRIKDICKNDESMIPRILNV